MFEVSAAVIFLQAGVIQSELHHRLLTVYVSTFSAKKKCLCGASDIKMAERTE
jgi:hypothetical protein